MQVSSYNFLRSSGSSRRAAISSSREAAMLLGNDSDPSRPRTADTTSAFQKLPSGGTRGSPIVSSENRRTASGRSSSNIKNFESALRGIESLNVNNNERVHY